MPLNKSGSKPSIHRRAILSGCIALFFLAGCLSPAIPLPPPGAPIVSAPSDSGEVLVVGKVPSSTTAFAHNLRSGQIVGQVTDNTGRYELVLLGESNDTLSIYYEEGVDVSPSILVTVPDADEVNDTSVSDNTNN